MAANIKEVGIPRGQSDAEQASDHFGNLLLHRVLVTNGLGVILIC